MLSVVAAFALAASVSQVVATPINHVARGYRQDADILEDYTPYHVRYLALNCQRKHNTDFFEQCCHPLLRWQKLEDRPAQCTPSASASSSAVLAEPTASVVDEDPIYDDDDCDDASSSLAPAAATTTYVAPEPAAATTTKEAAPETTSSAKAKAAQTTEKPQSTEQPQSTEKPQATEEPKTTSYKPEPTTSAEPKPTTSAAPSGGNDGAFTGGFATYFLQNGVAGACGKVHGEYDLIVAADYRRYGDLSKQSDLCGKTVVITNTKNGKTVTAVVADACPTCTNDNSLDLSQGAFQQIASFEDGMVPISWYFQ